MLAGMLVTAKAQQKYQAAPPEIREILDAPATPTISLSPTHDRMLIVQSVRYPPIADLSAPMVKLAGRRINPSNNGPHRTPRYASLTLKPLPDGKPRKVQVSANSKLGFPAWSPDGKHFAFVRFAQISVELWIADAETGAIQRFKNIALNAAFGEPFQWLPDSQTILCQTVIANRGRAPADAKVAIGPLTQETTGKSAPAQTYQDLLETPHDEDLFDYYGSSQLVLLNIRSGATTPLGKPGIFNSYDPSPDQRYFLIERMHRPYSFSLPATYFPRDVEVWDRTGKTAYKLASLPLAEETAPGGAATGPRRYQWRPTAPATLTWVEALDGGDPKKKVAFRDRVMMLPAPFTGAAEELARTEFRYSTIVWSEDNSIALLRDYQSGKRWVNTYVINPNEPSQPPRPLWSNSTQDRYNDPGTPLMKTLTNGVRVMRVHEGGIFLVGQGASPEGDRPTLDRLDLTTRRTERLFQCDERSFEYVVALAKDDGSQFISRRESAQESPNYFLRTPHNDAKIAITAFPEPPAKLRGIRKQIVTYAREDGVPLSFTLYLPPDYEPGQRLPTLLWAYPREYNDVDTAGQVSGSANRFTSITGPSQLFFALRGYAVLDGATMPVVGDPKNVNDTFLEQIVASAKAAVEKAVEMGVTDPGRVGVAGHSYGAFMTANLLAHSDLFRAGIARSGAYNRTLTPFGFQNEKRTLWEAPDMYLKNSPFLAADKIREPLLLIHGEADNNTGTFPFQSERLFAAVKGLGGKCRLVMLPYEAHAYEARESVEHVLWEMVTWFDKYVKHAGEPAPQ